jgi:hypothetical protein
MSSNARLSIQKSFKSYIHSFTNLVTQNAFSLGEWRICLWEYLLPRLFPSHTSKPSSASMYGSDLRPLAIHASEDCIKPSRLVSILGTHCIPCMTKTTPFFPDDSLFITLWIPNIYPSCQCQCRTFKHFGLGSKRLSTWWCWTSLLPASRQEWSSAPSSWQLFSILIVLEILSQL